MALISVARSARSCAGACRAAAAGNCAARCGAWPRARRRAQCACARSRRLTCRRWTVTRCARPTSRKAPVRLRVIGEVAAGRPFTATVGAGEAARIFTGGVVPERRRYRRRSGNHRARRRCRHRLKAGEQGPPHPPARPRFSPRRYPVRGRPSAHRARPRAHRRHEPSDGAGASAPHSRALRHRRRIGAARRGARAGADCLFERFRARRAGAPGGRRRDRSRPRPGPTSKRPWRLFGNARALAADILVTTGGASVGEYDLVHKAFAAEGMDLSFWKVAMRPGRPLMHGRLGGMHVLGLPGNPVSAYVCAFLFLVPLIRRMSGRDDLTMPTESARARLRPSGE